ncbi:MAG: hypothetical protein JST92_16290 [Deltaproteobacteria bacterium]|nr:hypothetical protein [Deltaproteobacteria bacterium]
MHRTSIPIVDIASNTVRDRPSNTPTFDVPADFDRTTTIAQLDGGAHLHYASVGKPVVRPAFPRPLSWRARGEECLVEEEGKKPGGNGPIRYLLSTIDRQQRAAPRLPNLRTPEGTSAPKRGSKSER